MTLAVIPAGYADGLDRRLENHGFVLIRGQRAKIVGAVSMDMLTADVTDIDGVGPGDEVVFLGSQGDTSIDAREMAAWIGTIRTRSCVASVRASNEIQLTRTWPRRHGATEPILCRR